MPRGRSNSPASQKLNIYLIKEGLVDDAQIIKDAATLDRFNVVTSGQVIGTLYFKSPPGHMPKWVSFLFQDSTDPRPQTINRSSSAILIIRREGHVFALAFGFGHHLLVPGSWEERFGLIVTLNSIIDGKIKSMDTQSFDTLSTHRRIQASKEGSFADFGLDIERDLLRSAVGTPDDKTLGTRMSGTDALHVHVPVDASGLSALLGRYFEKYREESYRQRYPWIDQLAEVRDATIINELDVQLIDKLNRQDLGRLWLAIPEIIDWNDINGFRYTGEQRNITHTDLHVADFLSTLEVNTPLSTELLRSKKVHATSASTGFDSYDWTVYQCLYCEIEKEGGVFFLSTGKWYRVARDFAESVNTAVQGITIRNDLLPDFNDRDEGSYNSRVASANDALALMDKKLIRLGRGLSAIEFCDLFSNEKLVIHVKRYGGSSVLSHLFAQGLVSGQLFVTEPEFRREVKELLPESHRGLIPTSRPAPDEFEIVFAIVSNSSHGIVDSLPFFSRINLRSATQALRSYQYKVSIVKIATTQPR
ncbi:MAG: TIGR04141 family sporadically distributed protein [Desulfobulbaceae bacterium]|nr:TIGR04141 family sporadically distributed protein [Desulfobulbaceae bacterium]